MREVKKNANELLNEEPEFGKQMVYLEENLMNPGKKQVSRIENFFPFNSALKKLCNDERMMVRVEELFGEPGVLFKDKINYKLPGEGEVTPSRYSKYQILQIFLFQFRFVLMKILSKMGSKFVLDFTKWSYRTYWGATI